MLFLFLAEGFILTDVVLEVHTIVVELLLAIDQRLLTTLLLFFELFDFLLYSVICQLGQEHFLLLLDKFIGILGTILLRELDTAASDVHGLVNVTLLLLGEVLALFCIILIRRDVTVFNSTQGCCTRGRIFVPDP